MAGLFEGLFGGGQQDPRPQADNTLDRMRATYAPNAYNAHQTSIQQQAVYDAAMQTPNMKPEIARALATNPQYFGAQQGSFLPQASQSQVLQGIGGEQTLGQIRNPGGGAGHGLEYSGMNIIAPGTTQSPAQASQGAPAGGAPATTGPTNTLQGIPGSTSQAIEKVKQTVAAGGDPIAALAGTPYANDVKAVLEGRQTLSEIKQTRSEHIAGTVRNLVNTINPDFNEMKQEATNTWVKGYMDTKQGTVGMSRAALGTSLGHISDAVDKQKDLDNYDANVTAAGSTVNHLRGLGGTQGAKIAGQQAQVTTAADELAKFLTGKPPTDTSRAQYRNAFPTPFDTPRVAAEKFQTMGDLLEKRMRDLELERDANFGGKNVAKDYPIVLEEHRKLLDNIRTKVSQLRSGGEQQVKGLGTIGGSDPAATELPPGWRVK